MVCVWMGGCVDGRVCGCVWMGGCVDGRVCGWEGVWMGGVERECVYLRRIMGHARMHARIHTHARTHVYLQSNIRQTDRHTHTHTHTFYSESRLNPRISDSSEVRAPRRYFEGCGSPSILA